MRPPVVFFHPSVPKLRSLGHQLQSELGSCTVTTAGHAPALSTQALRDGCTRLDPLISRLTHGHASGCSAPCRASLAPCWSAAAISPCWRLQVVHEIMRDLKVGDYTIKLNHRLLLDAMMRVGSPAVRPRQPPMIILMALGDASDDRQQLL